MFLSPNNDLQNPHCLCCDCLAPAFCASAQTTDTQHSSRDHSSPSFGIIEMWRPNYILTGVPLDRTINKQTADVKFQLSFALRVLRFGKVDILFGYTHRTLWNLYDKSNPVYDNNYNPGGWVTFPITRNDKGYGRLYFGFEHESNGLSKENSRGWNNFSAAYTIDLTPSLMLGMKLRGGYYERRGNPRIYRYKGIFEAWLTAHSASDRLRGSILISPTHNLHNYNITVDGSWRFTRNPKFPVALFVQLYSGYGECLLDYNVWGCTLRAGATIHLGQPRMR